MSNPVKGWTDARFRSFIRSALRKAWNKFPNRYKALNAARLPKKGLRKGRKVFLYECNICKNEFTGSQVVVDHIVPNPPFLSLDDLPAYTASLFCAEDNLQVVCKQCHYLKTLSERGLDARVVAFKKLKAGKQKELLQDLKLPQGANSDARIKIYKKFLDDKPS